MVPRSGGLVPRLQPLSRKSKRSQAPPAAVPAVACAETRPVVAVVSTGARQAKRKVEECPAAVPAGITVSVHKHFTITKWRIGEVIN